MLGGFAIGVRVALLWQHYGNAWQNPAVIRQAHRTPHARRTRTLRMPAKTPLAGDKMDAPAAVCAVPFRPYCGGVVTRTRNVSEYMLVIALCLVVAIISMTVSITAIIVMSRCRFHDIDIVGCAIKPLYSADSFLYNAATHLVSDHTADM